MSGGGKMNSFQTKSRAIELLGKKQIRDSITALIELIKNAYDADAKWCNVEFDMKHELPYLMISDSGCGMSAEDVMHKWLVIGTESKRKKDKLSPGGRVLMGEKGIGRLATSILGNQLLMLSKSEKDGKWNIIFADWNTFENQYAFLSDVNIGLSTDNSSLDYDLLTQTIKDLSKQVCSNIYKDVWYINDNKTSKKEVREDLKKLWNDINDELSSIKFDFDKLLRRVQQIDKKGSGTILYITNLQERWGQILDYNISAKDMKGNEFIRTSYIRLNTFIYPINIANNDFKANIWLNNQQRYFDYGFSDEDYNIYDVKISGKVEKGIFYGSIDVINADKELVEKCNSILKKGISLIDNIDNKFAEEYDCGDYSLELRHVEGTEKNSGISREIWDKQKHKLHRFGGVAIFRDGVRVLPYGEPQSDFLELESRRGKHAGLYMFVHRRLFGRIDITSKNNRKLEDKSSREGLLENAYYYYFITTLKNLLIKIAKEYLNGMGIKQSYINYNNEVSNLKQHQEKELKRQNKEITEEIKRIKALLKLNTNDLEQYQNNFVNDLKKYDVLKSNLLDSKEYIDINRCEKELQELIYVMLGQLSDVYQCIIVVQDKYKPAIEPEMMEDIIDFNKKATDIYEEYKEVVRKINEEIKSIYNTKMSEWTQNTEEITGMTLEQYSAVLFDELNLTNDKLKGVKQKLCASVEDAFSKYNSIVDIIEQELDDTDKVKAQINATIYSKYNELNLEIEEIGEKINSLKNTKSKDLNKNISDITSTIKKYNSDISEYMNDIESEVVHLSNNTAPKLKEINNFIHNDYSLSNTIEALTKRNIILEKENDILTDLAGVGLAAEVVDHEFNQYFNNVKSAIARLSRTSMNPRAKAYLGQIDRGFRGIANRHSQLSPMYRSYNYKRKDINIMNMLKSITDFYSVKIESADIKIKYDIDEKDTLFISTSKIYPVLSNLIDNAIYWTKSKKDRQILFKYDNIKKILYINDSGPGIPDRLKEQVFDMFFTLKPNLSGRGLGLSITKKILQNEGYTIELVCNKAEKVLPGACFKIDFSEGDKT